MSIILAIAFFGGSWDLAGEGPAVVSWLLTDVVNKPLASLVDGDPEYPADADDDSGACGNAERKAVRSERRESRGGRRGFVGWLFGRKFGGGAGLGNVRGGVR